jgi:hypothetical protein
MHPIQLWKLALLAMAPSQPTHIELDAPIPIVGASPASDGGLSGPAHLNLQTLSIPHAKSTAINLQYGALLAHAGLSAIKNEWSGLSWSVWAREWLFHLSRVVL